MFVARAGSRPRLVRWKAAWKAAAGRGPAPRGNAPQPKRGADTPQASRRVSTRQARVPAPRNRLRRAKIFRSSSTWTVSSSIGHSQAPCAKLGRAGLRRSSASILCSGIMVNALAIPFRAPADEKSGTHAAFEA